MLEMLNMHLRGVNYLKTTGLKCSSPVNFGSSHLPDPQHTICPQALAPPRTLSALLFWSSRVVLAQCNVLLPLPLGLAIPHLELKDAHCFFLSFLFYFESGKYVTEVLQKVASDC